MSKWVSDSSTDTKEHTNGVRKPYYKASAPVSSFQGKTTKNMIHLDKKKDGEMGAHLPRSGWPR